MVAGWKLGDVSAEIGDVLMQCVERLQRFSPENDVRKVRYCIVRLQQCYTVFCVLSC